MLSISMDRDLRNHLGYFVAIENRYARITSALARKILSGDDTVKVLSLQNDSGLTRLCLHYISSILRNEKPGTWENCLFQVSWRHQTPVPGDPSLEFLNYACRFWPTHFLLVREPDSSLKDAVIKFLLAPGVGERWFQLYLLSISQSTDPLTDYQKVQGPTTALPELGRTSL